MKTRKEFKEHLFRNSSIPQNSDNEVWFYSFIDQTFDFIDGWIPIEERLPEIDKNDCFSIDVLIKDKDNQPTTGYYDFIQSEWNFYNGHLPKPTHYKILIKND